MGERANEKIKCPICKKPALEGYQEMGTGSRIESEKSTLNGDNFISYLIFYTVNIK